MRDAEHLHEQPLPNNQRRTVAWLTAIALGGGVGLFGLGYVIGGRVARLDIAHEPPIDPIAKLDVQRKLHDDLTFYDDLTAKARPPRAPAAAETTPPRPTAAAPSALAEAAPPAGSARIKPSAGIPIAAKVAGSTPPPRAASGKSSGDAASGAGGLHAGPARAGEFTVQVSAHQSAEEAHASCASLERKGFRPFVVKSDLGGRGTWYRVRVGRFVDATQADRAKATLAQVDIPAWVLRTE
jgi:cell division septation protein DedD